MLSVFRRLSEASATARICSGRLSRPSCGPPWRVGREAEFGGDHDLAAQRRQRFADQFFIVERAVDFGGIEEGDAAFDRRAHQGDHGLAVGRLAVGVRHAHAAQAEGRDFQVSEFSFLHRALLTK
jgi:hypothetical protein